MNDILSLLTDQIDYVWHANDNNNYLIDTRDKYPVLLCAKCNTLD